MAKKISYSVWRPNKSGNGWATIFEYSEKQQAWYAVMMPQNGERSFDHTKKMTAKLGQADIGSILGVFLGRVNTVGEKGLYHTSNKDTKDSTVINCSNSDNGGFFFGISQKRGTNTSKGSVVLSLGDAIWLAELFRQTVVPMSTEEYVGKTTENGQQD